MADLLTMLVRKSPVATALLLVLASCGGFEGEGGPPAPGPETDGGEAGSGTVVENTPTDDQLTNDLGVFVTPSGSPEPDGTREKPFNAIAPAIEKARATTKRVYVCSGTFKEAVTVASGVPLIGGLDCSAPVWKVGSLHTRVESPTSPALRAEEIKQPTRVEGFDFVAPDGSADKPTSIGFLAKNAGGITIAKSSITAGRGHDGLAGSEGVQLVLAEGEAGAGGPPVLDDTEPVVTGGAGAIGSCTGAPALTGGQGGQGGKGGQYLAEDCGLLLGQPACPGLNLAWRNNYVWATVGGVNKIRPGIPPADGSPAPGADASPGNGGGSALSVGQFSADGFVPTDGTAGTNGSRGRGGAGGRGANNIPTSPARLHQGALSAGGPGGGAGGCPGMRGTAGRGGGASVGALLVGSLGLTFDAVTISSAAAGAGGKGSFGSSPTNGGAGASPQTGAAPASAGAPGGPAGVSGSGAGGSSVGIAYAEGEPTRTSTTITAGAAGAGVPEEKKADNLGNMKTLPMSTAGEAKELVAF